MVIVSVVPSVVSVLDVVIAGLVVVVSVVPSSILLDNVVVKSVLFRDVVVRAGCFVVGLIVVSDTNIVVDPSGEVFSVVVFIGEVMVVVFDVKTSSPFVTVVVVSVVFGLVDFVTVSVVVISPVGAMVVVTFDVPFGILVVTISVCSSPRVVETVVVSVVEIGDNDEVEEYTTVPSVVVTFFVTSPLGSLVVVSVS